MKAQAPGGRGGDGDGSTDSEGGFTAALQETPGDGGWQPIDGD